MPPLVRTCYESILRHAGPHPVRLLTQETLARYADLPPHIYRLVKRGCITRQHLSDLLRVSLLYTHGGIWMDLTIYVVRPIDTSRYNALWDTIKIHPQRPGTISRYRWAGFYEACAPGSEAMRSFRDVMFAYWETHTRIIDYLLIDYTFEMLYRKCPAFKQLVDEAPYGNERLYELAKILNEEYDPKYSSLFAEADFFKLNWRIPLREGRTVFHCLELYQTC